MSERRALLSVSDKTGIQEFAGALVQRGFEILSTGGTARTLAAANVPVTEVSRVTGHPEMMDGRVKTLHPAIHAGILARRDRPADLGALKSLGYAPIDLVAVNLYPFREAVAGGGTDPAEAMEQVDIGGPTLIRAAAKNHADVWVVADPGDYDEVLEALDRGGSGEEARRRLAARVFRHTGRYDEAVADYLEGLAEPEEGGDAAARAAGEADGPLAPELSLALRRVRTLRYGENPDQAAAFYRAGSGPRTGLAGLEQLHGKELSYNNLLDLDGALLSLSPFAFARRPAVSIVKHTTPCGLALGDSLEAAYRRALRTDPMSAFGSVIAANRRLDGGTATAMSELFIECVVAPSFSDEAREILTEKKSLRLLEIPAKVTPDVDLPVDPSEAPAWSSMDDEGRATARFLAAHGRAPEPRVLRSVYGGVLAQTPSTPPFLDLAEPDWEVVTERAPTDEESVDLAFAWAAIFGIKSNAILLAREGATLGIGAGQMSRVDASELAVKKAGAAGLDLEGSVLASDAFFPFRDGVDAAAEAGVTAIVQPGGSIRDQEVVEAADEHGLAMVFTGRRMFRH